MRKIKGAFSFLYKCFACYTIVVYALLTWIPFSGWISGFMMMTFPVIFACHIVFLIISLLSKEKRFVLPLVLVLLGCFFLPRTYGIHFNSKSEISQESRPFKIMSYNVHTFKNSAWYRREGEEEVSRMKNWIGTSGADVLCMPEFYNLDKSELFQTTRELKDNGFKYVKHLDLKEYNTPENFWGLVLFSKLPIVASKDMLFISQNGMIRADIKVGKDTVRVIAIHMYSMTLKLDSLKSQRTIKGFLRQGKLNSRLIKKGFTNHASEMNSLESWIKASPYPVIVCGDFNETPYSYVYGKARSLLRNSFEDKGKGFGFSFNRLPYFIRIDHHFYDANKINLIDFETDNTIKFSDHYPLMGTYQVKK